VADFVRCSSVLKLVLVSTTRSCLCAHRSVHVQIRDAQSLRAEFYH
jgi:hypothetical protein